MQGFALRLFWKRGLGGGGIFKNQYCMLFYNSIITFPKQILQIDHASTFKRFLAIKFPKNPKIHQ